MKYEGWGVWVTDYWTNKWADICDCRVTFANEKFLNLNSTVWDIT